MARPPNWALSHRRLSHAPARAGYEFAKFKNVFSIMHKVTNYLMSFHSSASTTDEHLSTARFFRGVGSLVLAFLVMGALSTFPATAQHEVTGTVTDAESGQTLPGVNVVVQGTQIGTTTRSDGTYTIEAPSPDETLVFSFVGYQNQEVPIEGRSQINVSLDLAVTALEEVVVSVGYGQRDVQTVTGSVSQVSGEDLEIEPTTNLTNTLQGTLPGVFGVNTSGRPGMDDSELLVRGRATLNDDAPLVVIDGVPDRQGGLARLNPADIESVSVLKDASAAIYGSRAANGVILVETKRGTSVGETQFNVNVEQSYSEPTVVPEMADAPTYMQMLNEVDQYRGTQPRFSQEEIDAHRNIPEGSWEAFDTDWYEVGLKDFASQTTANASVTGGIEDLQYRFSLRGVTQDGILVNSGTGYDQLGFRSNLDGDVTDALSMSFDVHGRLQDQDLPSWTRGINAAWEMLQRGKPTDPAFWPNGEPGPAQEQGVNPVVANKTGFENHKNYFFQSNLTLDVDIPAVDGWTAEGTVAYDQRLLSGKWWQKPWTLYSWDGTRNDSGDPVLTATEVGVPEPRLSEWRETERDILVRGVTRYETGFGDHNGSFLLGSEFQKGTGNEVNAFRRFFLTDAIDELFAGGTAQQDLDGVSWHSARFNFFGRANYNYQETYLLELVARYDGSYIFPEGDRFGFFPSVSAGWRFEQEDWFNNATGDFFDRLKIRASFGQTGNDRIEPYQFLRTFGFAGTDFSYRDGLGTAIEPTRVPNEDISWEVATQFDVGLQGAILQDRLSFDFTYFNHSRDDILWFRSESVPETAGFSLPRENIGKVNSQGFEGDVRFTQELSSDISYRVGANASYAKDEIVFFDEPEGREPWQQAEGNPMDTELYYIADGIWSDQSEIDNNPSWPGARPGDIRFRDVNEDGVIDGNDRRRINRNGNPDLMGSLNLGATAYQFDLRLQFQGAAQVSHYVFTGAAGEFGNYFQKFAERRWTPDNQDASGPRAYNRVDPYWAQNQNTFFLRDAKYLRLKSAQLSYRLPSRWIDTAGFQQVRAYVSGRNLFTLTPLDIMDPELRNGAAHEYPPNRTFTFGLQTSF